VTHALPRDLADAIAGARHRLPGTLDVRYFDEVDSTNEVALTLAAAGAREATAVLAGAQTAGRGRRGRSWFSPPGAGLYLSCILREVSGGDDAAGQPLPLVTLAAGVAAATAVAIVTSLPVELKWPNDLVIGRPRRKLAGILCESLTVGSAVDAVIIGIGINVRTAAYPSELADRATSIEAELGREIERGPLAVECVIQLFERVARLRQGHSDRVLEEWRSLARAGLENAAVRWHDRGEARHGRARDIDADGALLVDAGGQVERIVSGEVTWETSI
jgi:BirA family biotin operon repressor/biotin-[acetyl-CoA-carboxylase] ligase